MITQHEVNLGQLLTTGTAMRDAIHIAVVPMVAGDDLKPGDRVDNTADRPNVAVKVRGKYYTYIGIVDPFLQDVVKKGARFWMLLRPGTITSLRHNWTHPAFDFAGAEEEAEEEYVPPAIATIRKQRQAVAEKQAQEFLKEYAEQLEVSVEELIEGARRYQQEQEMFCIGTETPDIAWNDHSTQRFWEAFGVITGEYVPVAKRDSFVRCAC